MPDLTLVQMREEAYLLFQQYAEPCCDPSIEGLEMAILNRNMRAEVWRPSTAYLLGDIVQVYPRNGYRYRAVQSGTSGVLILSAGHYRYSREISDGTVGWIIDGPDYDNVYDVRAAAHEAWTIKASRSSHLVTTSAGGSSVQASSLHSQCRARAMEFAPVL